MAPTAAVSATTDPEIPENRYSVTTTTCPRPPRKWPTRVRAILNRRTVIPTVSISSPARMKNGIDSSVKASIPE